MEDMNPEHKALLLVFFAEYLAWAEQAPAHSSEPPFHTDLGLCDNLVCWLQEKGYGDTESLYVKMSMAQAFVDKGLDRFFPFGFQAYDRDFLYGTQHKNPLRIQFMLDFIDECDA